MKITRVRLAAVLMSLLLLCGCAAGNNAAGDQNQNGTSNAVTDNSSQNDAGNASGGNTSDLSGENGSEEDTEDEPSEPGTPLSSVELKEWNWFFSQTENNGLLRFPYSNPVDDPMQLAPYLELLFYDLGDKESQISEEEFALLTEQDAPIELDTSRLTRSFAAKYLADKFGISTEKLLSEAKWGYYLEKYDAWYLIHGDTWFDWYDFDRGEKYEDGTVKLYYKGFIGFTNDSGALDFDTASMAVTLSDASGQWRVVSNKIVGETNGSTAPGDLSANELAVWENRFNADEDHETNGLLRFPYTDVQNDPEQIIPYLWLLFYDTHVGEPVTDEERELLEQRYQIPDTGLSRLLRGYVTIYLRDYFGLDEDVAKRLMTDPDPAPSQYYLGERDSWYMAHGDTAYQAYDFDRGVRIDDKTIKLYYGVDFLEIVGEDGLPSILINQNMVATIHQDGESWYVISNEVVPEN